MYDTCSNGRDEHGCEYKIFNEISSVMKRYLSYQGDASKIDMRVEFAMKIIFKNIIGM